MPIRSDQSKSYLNELVKLSKSDLVSIGYQKLTVDGTVGGVGLTIPTNARYALVVAESTISTTAIRCLECGNTIQAVSAGTGIPIVTGDRFDIQGTQNLSNFRAIQEAAGTHYLHIQYYK